jgi:hypothetical protein
MTGQVREPRFPPKRVAGRGRGWYRGDCHIHSARSHGGELTPEQLAAARATGLDFIAITEHNTADTHGAWGSLAGDDLLVILGQEAVTQTGHWLALGIGPGQVVEWRYGVRHDVIGLHVSQVRRAGGLCVAAHPHAPYPAGIFMYPLDGLDAVEVWNGLWSSDRPWNADNDAAVAEWGRALAAGICGERWLPAIGCSDTHLDGQIAIPHTVVLADELSTSAILAGIKAGNSWIAGSAEVSLSLQIRSGDRVAGIGEQLETSGEPAVVQAVAVGHGQLSHRPGHSPPRTTACRGTRHHRMVHQRRGISIRQGRGAAPGQQMAALTNPVIVS